MHIQEIRKQVISMETNPKIEEKTQEKKRKHSSLSMMMTYPLVLFMFIAAYHFFAMFFYGSRGIDKSNFYKLLIDIIIIVILDKMSDAAWHADREIADLKNRVSELEKYQDRIRLPK
jgi:hypothetical protein